MKPAKRIIQIAKHIPTGAHVPMLVGIINKDNVITDYKEFLENRKGFTLSMLQDRWDKCRDDVIELLQKYQVPAHVNHHDVQKLEPHQLPIDAAVFFEEYVFGVEKKEKLSHNKLKPRKIEKFRQH